MEQFEYENLLCRAWDRYIWWVVLEGLEEKAPQEFSLNREMGPEGFFHWASRPVMAASTSVPISPQIQQIQAAVSCSPLTVSCSSLTAEEKFTNPVSHHAFVRLKKIRNYLKHFNSFWPNFLDEVDDQLSFFINFLKNWRETPCEDIQTQAAIELLYQNYWGNDG